jgi:hypothetical protein
MRESKSKSMNSQSISQISVDRSTGRDLLKRAGFARHLLLVLKGVDADQGAVIGLEGPWGSGKTSVVGLMKGIAVETPEAIQFIQFSPWMVSGTNDMVRALLMEILSHSVAKTDKRWWRFWKGKPTSDAVEAFGQQLLNYVKVLEYVKHAGPLAEMVMPGGSLVAAGVATAAAEASKEAEGAPSAFARLLRRSAVPSLTEVKRDVAQAASQLPRRIVVVIDDLDRLPPQEIGTIIQAVKAVADFPNVLYLLCYDRTTLASGIESALHVSDGEAYLEKIVQIPLPLPEIPGSRFTGYAVDRLNSCLSAFDLPKEELSRVEAALKIVASLMDNPREVERLRTRLTVVLPHAIGEINTGDLIVLEAIAQTHPAIISEIRERPSSYMSLGIYDNVPTISDRGLIGNKYSEFVESKKKKDENSFEYASHDFAKKFSKNYKELVPLIHAMEFVFPRLALGHQRSHKNLPASRFRYWYAWLCLHDHQDPWNHNQLRNLVTAPLIAISSGISQDADLFEDFCTLVCDIEDESAQPANHIDVASFFIDASHHLPRGVVATWGRGYGYGPLTALQKLLMPFTPEQRREAAQKLIQEADVWLMGPLLYVIQQELVRTQQRGSDPEDDAVFANLSIAQPIIESWRDKAEEALRSGAISTTFQPDDFHSPHRLIKILRYFDLPTDAANSLTRPYTRNAQQAQIFFGDLLMTHFISDHESVFDESVLEQSDQFAPLIDRLHEQGLCFSDFVARFKNDVAAFKARE